MERRAYLAGLVGAILLAVFIHPGRSPAQIAFERTYGGSENDIGEFVQQTLDEGYIIVGHTRSFGAGEPDVYLIKTDSLGETLWTRTYGGLDEDRGNSVQQTQEGGYVIAGRTESFGAGSFDVYLVKTDSTGNTVWTRTYGGLANDYGKCVQQTMDGGFAIAGHTGSFGAGLMDVYLIKTDSAGDTVWTRTYGGVDWENGYSVQQGHDGGYVIVGRTRSFGAGSYDVYLIKTDSLGDALWTRTYGGPDQEFGWSVQQDQDGGYIIAGGTLSFGTGSYDVYLVRTDSVGDTVWTRTYGGTGWDAASAVQQNQDGGYIIGGRTGSFGAGNTDVYLIRTDSVGDTVWMRTYGRADEEYASSAQHTVDGGYIIVGSTASFGAGETDVYLIKTDGNGLVGIGEEKDIEDDSLRAELLQNRPNPFCSETTIRYQISVGGPVRVRIYDITGRLVETLADETRETGLHTALWNAEGKSAGIYFCRLQVGGFTDTRKMTLLR